MKKWFCVLLSVVLTLAVASACVSIGHCQAGTEVSLIAPEKVAPEEVFWVEVHVEGISDFDAASYDITYDPTVLEVTGVTGGILDGTAIPVSMWGYIPAGVQGTVRLINNVIGVPGVSGDGYLAKVQFRAIGSYGEATEMSLHNGLLGNNLAKEIEADWFSDSVSLHIAGDADEDGVVTTFDITAVEQMILGMVPVTISADADGDGSVTVLDATAIERIILL